MDNDKVKIDEKTARNIEEMDKSLRNMEQAMGPDHPVLAKILDSYAKLLRQNNIRHLDAVNMEARAKHIRAKHNQQEEKAQIDVLTTSAAPRKKGMSMAQARILVWCVAAVVFGAIGLGAFEVIKGSSKNIKNVSKKFKTAKDGDDSSFVVDADSNTVPVPQGDAGGSSNVASNPPLAQDRPSSGPSMMESQTVTRTAPQQTESITVLEFAKKSLEVKSFAKEKVSEAMELERNKEFAAAAQAYFSVISMAQQVSSQVGRPIYSESIAKAFEGYGRMAELDNHPDIAQQSEKAAADVRSHLDSSDE